MSFNSQLTRNHILKCALKEFTEHTYQKANMRRIAEAAKVTTGAMYNHFANKSVLFDALVQGPAEAMLNRFRNLHNEAKNALIGMTSIQMKKMSYAGTDWMLDYIYENREVFKLVFCCSESTRWSTYLEELIAIEEQSYRIYCDSLGKSGKRIEDMFLHINAASGFQYLVEIVSHDLPYEQAVAVMDSAKRFGMAGWQEIVGRES